MANLAGTEECGHFHLIQGNTLYVGRCDITGEIEDCCGDCRWCLHKDERASGAYDTRTS